jgi:hypothetical protein
MKRRGVRLALLALFLAVAAGAGVTLFQGDQRATTLRNSLRGFEFVSQRAQLAVVDARTSLLAALLPGQGDDYWLPKAGEALAAARAELSALKQQTADGTVLNDLDAASAALDQADELRGEVTRLLHDDLRTQAAATVVGRGLEHLAAAAERIEGARTGEVSRADGELAALRAYELLGAGVVLALGLVLMGLLLPAGAAEPAAATDDLPVETTQPEPSHGSLSLSLSAPAEPRAEAATVAASQAAAALPAYAEPLPSPLPAQADRRKAPELRAAADLCTDFARLVDAQEMPALLDRAAKLLDATGFIVWMADPSGQLLRPALAHGYPARALARLPAIARHADNATAAAYRHAEMQIVRTNGMSPGAIVVPVLGPSGCIGAIAAEVRHGREASESVRALARIVAAQLSTLVSAAAAGAAASGSEVAAAEQGAAKQAG